LPYGPHSGDCVWYPTASLTATEVDNEPVTEVLYVDAGAPGVNNGSSWAGAYTDLRTAMDLAAAHSNVQEIRVAQGTYKPAGPSGSRNSTFQLRNGLTLEGATPVSARQTRMPVMSASMRPFSAAI